MRKIEKLRIGCVIKPHAPNVKEALQRLIDYFEQKGLNYLLEEAAAEKLNRGNAKLFWRFL